MTLTIIFALVLFFPLSGIADGYWLDIKGSGKVKEAVKVSVYFGGVDDDSRRYVKKGARLDKLSGFKVYALDAEGVRTDIPIRQLDDHWEGTFVPEREGTYRVLAIHESLPVVDRSRSSGKNIRPVQYLCAGYQVGKTKSAVSPQQLVDIVTEKNGEKVNIQAFFRQKPVPENTRFRIFNPENWEKLPVADASGKAAFIPTMKGMYIIRVEWTDERPGNYLGLHYENIRHRCDYSLFIP